MTRLVYSGDYVFSVWRYPQLTDLLIVVIESGNIFLGIRSKLFKYFFVNRYVLGVLDLFTDIVICLRIVSPIFSQRSSTLMIIEMSEELLWCIEGIVLRTLTIPRSVVVSLILGVEVFNNTVFCVRSFICFLAFRLWNYLQESHFIACRVFFFISYQSLPSYFHSEMSTVLVVLIPAFCNSTRSYVLLQM